MSIFILRVFLLSTWTVLPSMVESRRVSGAEYWFGNSCDNANELIRRKGELSQQIAKLQYSDRYKNGTKDKGNSETALKYHVLKLFEREINDSEAFVFSALNVLSETLKGNLDEIDKLKEHSLHRIRNLQRAIFNEELELKEISELEQGIQRLERNKKFHNHSRNAIRDLFDQMLDDLHIAASDIGVDGKKQNETNNRQMGEIEAVFQIRGEDEKAGDLDRPAEILVDTRNNKYILSKPKDATMSFEDRRLMLDILLIIITAFSLSHLMTICSLPFTLGYIFTGLMIGPSGLNMITDIVQIETLGEIGVFFAVFDIGLNFSFSRLRQYWQMTILAFPLVASLLFITFTLFSSFTGLSRMETGIVSYCFSLSTTHLGLRAHEDHVKMYLSGQDVYFGLVLGFLPSLQDVRLDALFCFVMAKTTILCGAITLGVQYGAMFISVSDNYTPKIRQFINVNYPSLIILTLFAIVLLCEVFEVSTEFLCFFYGALLQNSGVTGLNQERMVIFKQVFSSLFYSTIGFHLFPSFVYTELSLVVVLTAIVLSIKFCFLFIVFSKLMHKSGSSLKLFTIVATCNVGELSLIIGSRARLYSLLSKEVYLIVISISTVSLGLTPFWSYLVTGNTKTNGSPNPIINVA